MYELQNCDYIVLLQEKKTQVVFLENDGVGCKLGARGTQVIFLNLTSIRNMRGLKGKYLIIKGQKKPFVEFQQKAFKYYKKRILLLFRTTR